MLVAAPSANAAFGLADLSAQPANGSAGANSDFTISLTVQDPAADLKDLTIHLPPGLVGNPLATPTCSESDLNADHCDPVSQVGTTATGALLSGTIPITVPGNVYNVAPRPGEPARFGIVLHPGPGLPPTVLQSGASLRQSDFGLDTVLNNLPNTASGSPDRHHLGLADPARDRRRSPDGLHPQSDLLRGARGRIRRRGV